MSQQDTEKVEFIGKVAKFPNDVEAHKALTFLEKVKIRRDKIWYIIVEHQQDQLQMLKYNLKNEVNLAKFGDDLKQYYLENFKEQRHLKQIIDDLEIVGEDKFVVIKNIPKVKLAGRPLIGRIAEDLIKLLGK